MAKTMEKTAKTVEYATQTITNDDTDFEELLDCIDVLLKEIKRATSSLKESIEEWQRDSEYLD